MTKGKPLTWRLENCFKDDVPAVVKDYSDKVYASWTDLTGSLRRNAVLVFLIAAIFELLTSQKSSATISFGSLSLSSSPVVELALPVLFALLFYDGFRLTSRWLELQTAYYKLVKMAAPKVSKNDLDFLIRPELPVFWAIGKIGSHETSQPSDVFIGRASQAIAIFAIWIFPVAFEAQAYYELFGKFGYHDIFLWISAILTTALIVIGVVYVMMYYRELR